MTLLKLVWYDKEDEFRKATVIGDIYSVYELYWYLRENGMRNRKIEVFDIGSGIKLDMGMGGLPEIISRAERLNSGPRY